MKELQGYSPYIQEDNTLKDLDSKKFQLPISVMTYGSTPFETFKELLLNHIDLIDTTKKFYCIGSSIGWMCFYANHLLGIESIGIDIY
jgi:hypothetical protein